LSVSKADSELATRVRDAIGKTQNKDANNDPAKASDPATVEGKAKPNLEITAKNGAVFLSGSVPSETERTAFEQAATEVPGVKSVENYLTVTKSNRQ
jgi:osmotically-inducible protein OsmY